MNTVEASLSLKVEEWKESRGRVVIGGGPRVGKSYLADRLEAKGITVHRTDFLVGSHDWSDASAEVAKWMGEPGPWVIEGVASIRAIRKRMEAHPGRPCDLLVWMRGPRVELTPGQRSMTGGCETILGKVRPDLVRRGVNIMEVP